MKVELKDIHNSIVLKCSKCCCEIVKVLVIGNMYMDPTQMLSV